jgi:hypothetical protein
MRDPPAGYQFIFGERTGAGADKKLKLIFSSATRNDFRRKLVQNRKTRLPGFFSPFAAYSHSA